MKSLAVLLIACFACVSATQAAQTTKASQTTQQASVSVFHQDKPLKQYRKINKASYLVVDTAEFYLYKYNKLVQGEKIARPTDVYYFSVTADGPMLELTRANLETAFSSNSTFIYKLHSEFRSDKDLMSYIPALKTYKIKYAYAQSLK